MTLDLKGSLLFGIRTVVFLIVLMPLLVTTNTFFPFIVGKAIYARSLIEVAFGLWLVLAYAFPAYRPRRSWLVLGFAVYLIVAIVAGLTGVSFQRSLWSTYERMQGIFDLAHWFVLVLVVTSVYRTSIEWRTLLNFNLAVSVMMAILGVAQRYDLWGFGFYGFLENAPRLDITLGNSTFVGAYMLVNVLIAVGFLAQSLRPATRQPGPPARSRRRRRRREAEAGISPIVWWQLFWTVAVGLDLWMLLLSGTRGAIIGLGAGLIAFAVGYALWGQAQEIRTAAKYLVVALALVVVLFASARNTSPFQAVCDSSVVVSRLCSINADDVSVKGRVASWSAGLRGFLSRPALGWGPENYIIASGRHFSSESGVAETFDQAHNKLVEELTTKGLIGFLAYMSLWVLMATAVIRRVRVKDLDAGEQLFLMFVGAAMAAYFVQNLFLFDTPATVLQFVILLGFAAHLEMTSDSPMVLPSWARRLVAIPFRPSASASGAPSSAAGGVAIAESPPAIAVGAVAMAVTALVATSVFLLNYRPFQAAREIVQIASIDDWSGVAAQFDKSIDTFRPLANYPRFIFITTVAGNWGALTEDERVAAIKMAERVAEDAFDAEPELWRVYAALGALYQTASEDDPAYLERARLNVAKAVELAPETALVLAVEERQRTVEEAAESARDGGSAE
ncbi:MAG: O-antigen ligase family protein [Chloroflexi bacterium]|nr:O-antigen ligase family protein [Chloroflexota bacterium]